MLSIHDAALLKFIPDYKINLVVPADFQEDEYRKFHTPLGQVLEYIRVSRDKEKHPLSACERARSVCRFSVSTQ